MSVRKGSGFAVGGHIAGSELQEALLLESMLAAMIKEFGYIQLSTEEIEDAPELEIRHNFELDLYELRTR